MIETLFETFLESLWTLPFLFGAYLLIEYTEKRSSDKLVRLLTSSGGWGVPLGAVTGLVPQCGFSVASANLYAGGIISGGALIAVFMSTSDEALLILFAHPKSWLLLVVLMLLKVAFAIAFGYLFNVLFKRFSFVPQSGANTLCRDCGCESESGILKPALKHTLKIYLFILIISEAINAGIFLLGEERLASFLLSGSALQIPLAALVGLIPNCAASVVLAELYISGGLKFSALVAGLCAAAGLGIVVLFRADKNLKRDFSILAYFFVAAVLSGFVVSVFGL